MICNFWAKTLASDPNADWSKLRIWKRDLKGAYTLQSFRPEVEGLFGMMLTGDIVYFHFVGIFGWAGAPATFQVVMRAIQWESSHCLQNFTIMYVDNIIGVSMDDYVADDLQRARDICTGLLGPTAVADEKTEEGRKVDVIGYVIDLDSQRVSIARKNYLSALHSFVSIDVEKKMGLRIAQRLASWASRYGQICRVMRPLCGALNRLIAGRSAPRVLFVLSAEVKIAIKSWQAMLCLIRYQEFRFTRTIESFSPALPLTIAEFDASLSGAGLIWYQRTNGAEVAMGVCAVELYLF